MIPKHHRVNKFIVRLERTLRNKSEEHLEMDIYCKHKRLYPNNTFVRDLVTIFNDRDIRVINNGRMFEKNKVTDLDKKDKVTDLHKEAKVPDRHKEANVPDLHKEANVPDLHKEANVPDLHKDHQYYLRQLDDMDAEDESTEASTEKLQRTSIAPPTTLSSQHTEPDEEVAPPHSAAAPPKPKKRHRKNKQSSSKFVKKERSHEHSLLLSDRDGSGFHVAFDSAGGNGTVAQLPRGGSPVLRAREEDEWDRMLSSSRSEHSEVDHHRPSERDFYGATLRPDSAELRRSEDLARGDAGDQRRGRDWPRDGRGDRTRGDYRQDMREEIRDETNLLRHGSNELNAARDERRHPEEDSLDRLRDMYKASVYEQARADAIARHAEMYQFQKVDEEQRWKKGKNRTQVISDEAPEWPYSNQPSPRDRWATHAPDRDSPVRHMADRDSPVRHMVDRDSPVRHTVDRDNPMRHAVDRDGPVRHAVDRDSPVRHAHDRDSPVRHAVGRGGPVRHSADTRFSARMPSKDRVPIGTRTSVHQADLPRKSWPKAEAVAWDPWAPRGAGAPAPRAQAASARKADADPHDAVDRLVYSDVWDRDAAPPPADGENDQRVSDLAKEVMVDYEDAATEAPGYRAGSREADAEGDAGADAGGDAAGDAAGDAGGDPGSGADAGGDAAGAPAPRGKALRVRLKSNMTFNLGDELLNWRRMQVARGLPAYSRRPPAPAGGARAGAAASSLAKREPRHLKWPRYRVLNLTPRDGAAARMTGLDSQSDSVSDEADTQLI